MGEKEGGGLGMALINVSFVFSIKKCMSSYAQKCISF